MISHAKYIFFIYLLVIFLLAIISSCATISKQETDTAKDSTASSPTSIHTANITSAKFSDDANIVMKASISFKFPDISNSVTAVIEMAKRDSILITITGPFGISVGKLYANPNEFIMNNNLQSITFVGTPTEKNIMLITNIPLSFNDLVSIFRTTTPQNANNYVYNSELSNNELSLFQLTEFADVITSDGVTSEAELYQELIYINLHNDIVRMERQDISGQTIIVANFTEHYTVGQYRFAKNLSLNFPTLNGNVEVKISDISITTQPTTPMRFQKPKSYREFRFD